MARCSQPAPAPSHTAMGSTQGEFVRPTSLAEALEIIAERPDAQLVAGSTDWGVDLNLKHSRAALSVGIDRLDRTAGARRSATTRSRSGPP